ncbi:MAG: hypothetical protein AB1689_12260 [Thermodesulfobacteriota bacterium]
MSTPADSKRASAPTGGTTVGSYVDALCGKCKEMTSHIVLAKIGSVPTRVECRTCHAMHAYRVPGTRRTSTSSAARARPAPDPAQVWADAMRRAQGAAVTYSIDRHYDVGTRLSHPTFGEGVVVRHASTSVCEAVFRDRAVKLKMGTAAS